MSDKSLREGAQLPPLKPGVLRVYSMNYCPFAQRTRLVLQAKQIPFEVVNINLSSKPKWFWEKNPKGEVPVLEKDGKIVYDSLICNDYLDAVYPTKLNPTDPYQKARDMILMDENTKLTKPYYAIIKAGGKDEETNNAYLLAPQRLEEELAKRGPYFAGQTPGMIDYNLWPFYERLGVIFKLVEGMEAKFRKKYPLITAWEKKMLEDQAVKTFWRPVEKHLAFYKSYLDGAPNFDI